MPNTTLIDGDDRARRSASRRNDVQRRGRGDRVPERRRARRSQRLATDRGQRQQHDHAEPRAWPTPTRSERAAEPADGAARPARRSASPASSGRRRRSGSDAPSSGGLLVDLGDRSRCPRRTARRSTSLQPPRSSMRPQLLRRREVARRTPRRRAGSTGRKPASAQIFWPSGVYRKFFERLGLLRVRAGVDDRDRVLDLEGLRRVDVLDVLALPLGDDRLVLVAEQHVAGALQEDVGGLAAGPRPRS